MIRLNRLFVFLLLTCAALSLVRADDYITVDPGELKKSPQDFWARGIVFSDTVENITGGEAVKLGDKRYQPIQTLLVGTCYLDPDIEGGAASLQVGQEYAFSGSVYQKDGGFFSSKRQFYVVIKRATLSAKGAGALTPEQLAALASITITNIYTEPLRILDAIVAQALRELQAYCSASNIPIQAVFDPQSRHAPRLIQSVRQAIYSQETKSRTPAVEFLVTLVASFMANQQGLLPTAATAPEPVVEVEPPAEQAPEESVAAEPAVMLEPVAEPETPAVAAEEINPPEIVAPIEPMPEPVVEEVVTESVVPAEPEPPALQEPEPMPEPTPIEVAPETLLEPTLEAPIENPGPSPIIETVEPEPPALVDPVAPAEESIPGPAPVEPAVENAPPVEVSLEPVIEAVPEEVAPHRRTSTLPAATLKLPATPTPEKPKKSKTKKAKVEEPAPETTTPVKKPSLLDTDPTAPVPMR